MVQLERMWVRRKFPVCCDAFTFMLEWRGREMTGGDPTSQMADMEEIGDYLLG